MENFKKTLDKYLTSKTAIIVIFTTLIFHFFSKISYIFRHQLFGNIIEKIVFTLSKIDQIYSEPLLTFNMKDLIFASGCTLIIALLIRSRISKDKRETREGEEYGSARWGTSKEIADFMDKDKFQNILLSKSEGLTMNSRPKNWKTARNKNVLIVGGAGSGKTRYYAKPNIAQMHSSYVITDPKGTLINELGYMLEKGGRKEKRDKNGYIQRDNKGEVIYLKTPDGKYIRDPYKIRVLNLINFKKSMHYNPFSYIRDEKDIMKLVNTIIINTKGEGDKAGEDFWVKAERLLYMAYIGLIFYEAPEEEQNFETLLMLIDMSKTREDDEDYENGVDLKFKDLEKNNPDHFAVRQYKKYKLAAGKTTKSIAVSCGARLAPFDIKDLRDLMSYDELELDKIGDRRTALFVIVPDTDSTFNFIVAMMYTQMFNLLCTKADDVYGGRLPYHVRCILDEFANIGQIPQFEKLIATIRSREISANIILQTKSQLKAIYKDSCDTIIGNCDTSIFLGGKEETTLKSLSEGLGKQTIKTYTKGESRGQSRSSSTNTQGIGRELMTQDELKTMEGDECIVEIRGLRPFKSKKYSLESHPNYKLMSDYSDKNTFNVKRILSSERKFIRK